MGRTIDTKTVDATRHPLAVMRWGGQRVETRSQILEPMYGNVEVSSSKSWLKVEHAPIFSFKACSKMVLEGRKWRQATRLSPCLAAEKKL